MSTDPIAPLRRSDAETFEGCPYRYDQVVNHGLEDQGDEAKRGVAFHVVAYAYIKLLAAAGLESDWELADQALTAGLAATHTPTHLVADVSALWQRHAERFELDLDAYFEAEARQQTRRFRFTPDLVYVRPHELEIVDWKTYYKGLTEAQARREFQVIFYLLQALELWPGFDVYRFTFVFVRLGWSVSVAFTPREIEAFRPRVDGVVQAIDRAAETGEYPAVPGAHCSFCRLHCPIADNPRLLPIRITDQAQAAKVAGEILVLERRLKLLRKALSGYCALDGEIVQGGMSFAHAGSVSTRYPAERALALLKRFKIPTDLATLSKAGLGVTLPARVAEELEGLAVAQHRSRFVARKAGEIQPALPDVLADEDDEP